MGINTGIEYAYTIPTGFWVNGVEITQGNFNQTTFAPQHFVLTAGPDGTTCFLNGVATPAATCPSGYPAVESCLPGTGVFRL